MCLHSCNIRVFQITMTTGWLQMLLLAIIVTYVTGGASLKDQIDALNKLLDSSGKSQKNNCAGASGQDK